MSSSEDDDWFTKDEEELVKNIKIHEAAPQNVQPTKVEYIQTSVSEDDKYLRQQSLQASSKPSISVPRISTADLKKLAEQNVLHLFLLIFTQEKPNFLKDQIAFHDSMERVLVYIRVLAKVCELKVPGFHKDLLTSFVSNNELLNQFRIILTKLLAKKYKNLWKSENDKQHLDKGICDMQILFVQAHALELLNSKALELLVEIKRLIEKSDSPEIKQRPTFLEFAEQLRNILALADEKEAIGVEETSEFFEASKEIYPTLDELLRVDDERSVFKNLSLLSYEYKSTNEYIAIQKKALRDDFILSLCACVRELKETKTLSPSLETQIILLENVEIVLNEEFLTSRRHKMLFINVHIHEDPKIDKITINKLKNLKTGSLICLTTSYDFENLILAVVSYQDLELTLAGYIAIEIERQFNIGNIYNKKLIMFSSPAFFEPYDKVYKYLSSCSSDDFPMQEQIVFGKPSITPPKYLKNATTYVADKCSFKPLNEDALLKLPLNPSQREALSQTLKRKFSLIQGPPGTGKTHLSVQLVKLLVENPTPHPIIVVAFTNDSLDKFLLKISAYTSSIARLGSQSRLKEISKYNVEEVVVSDHIHPQLKRLYYLVNMKFKAEFEHLQRVQKDFDGTEEGYQLVLTAQRNVGAVVEKLNTIRLLFRYYLVRERKVVALTTTCAAKMNFLFRLLESQIVIFEEAAEILESHVLACLTPLTQHVIMIGDHMQLKPYTSDFQHSRSYDFNISLFERLIQRNIITPAVLLSQYRMRPIIAELMTPIFYPKLYNDDSVEKYPLVRGMNSNLYFATHEKPENQSKNDPSLFNNYEVKCIIELAEYLVKEANYECDDIVILSPYAKQVHLFKSKLPEHLKAIRATTVDSFQGLEANIILLSLVRSNRENRLGFLSEKNRICVALSRAKIGLYIVGNMKLLSSCSGTWRSIKDVLNSHELIGEQFPYSNEVLNLTEFDSDEDL